MKFYEVETPDGPRLVGTQVEAKKFTKNARTVDVPTDKDGLMAYINDLRAYAVAEGELNVEQAPAAAPKPIGYAEQAVSFEDGFESMTLALKLHFAALAMEAARDEL